MNNSLYWKSDLFDDLVFLVVCGADLSNVNRYFEITFKTV